ncbi:MAG: hypothetical protein GY694_07430 [Gammaproteobacteria bacterium]|nr:hypothetical protein [Gammaproteobacteria bacterium]
MSINFVPNNPDALIYENELLRMTVLGGIRLEGLDRLRATMKVELKESARPPVRHNLDLYNDNQLEKFIRKCAERLEIGTSVIAASLSELTTHLETYRLEELEKQRSIELSEIETLSRDEKEKALQYGSAGNLMERTIEDLQSSGIIGEATNAMILNLAMTTRQMETPVSVICLAKSGMGKSYLMEMVSKCHPQWTIKDQMQFSGNSLYYFDKEELKHIVILIEDLQGAQKVLFPVRELITKKKIKKTVVAKDKNGRLKTITIIVEGPVSVIACTTDESLYTDNENRVLLIHLDGSKEQDKRIMDYQRKQKANLIDETVEEQVRKRLQNLQQVLQPIKVINPYAMLIDLPEIVFTKRRTLPLLLNFIDGITFYHQLQREQKAERDGGEIYIETEPSDIEWAFKLLREVIFRKSDELTGALRSFYEWLLNWDGSREEEKFNLQAIRSSRRIIPRTLRYYMKQLLDYGYVKVVGGKKHTGYEYGIIEGYSGQYLESQIDQHIKKVMDRVWKAHKKRNA